jgi:hypothetical protein
MEVRPGPESSLLLLEGDNKAGDWGKLYWPQSHEFVSLKPEILPDLPKRDLRAVFWLESQQRLLAFADEEVWFIPYTELKNLPRRKVA